MNSTTPRNGRQLKINGHPVGTWDQAPPKRRPRFSASPVTNTTITTIAPAPLNFNRIADAVVRERAEEQAEYEAREQAESAANDPDNFESYVAGSETSITPTPPPALPDPGGFEENQAIAAREQGEQTAPATPSGQPQPSNSAIEALLLTRPNLLHTWCDAIYQEADRRKAAAEDRRQRDDVANNIANAHDGIFQTARRLIAEGQETTPEALRLEARRLARHPANIDIAPTFDALAEDLAQPDELRETVETYTDADAVELLQQALAEAFHEDHETASAREGKARIVCDFVHAATGNGNQIMSAADMLATYTEYPPAVLEGLLRERQVMSIIGGSKTCKSWLALDLAAAAATSGSWLGFQAVKPFNVLLIDGENERATITMRLRHILRCRNNLSETDDAMQRIDIISTMDNPTTLDKLAGTLPRDRYGLTIVDPIYSFLPDGASELDDADMRALCKAMTRVKVRTGAALVFTHHTPKGSQRGRRAIDMASGSGVLGRFPQVSVAFTPNENNEHEAMMVPISRTFPPTPTTPMYRDAENPIWTRSTGGDATGPAANADNMLAMQFANVGASPELQTKDEIVDIARVSMRKPNGDRYSRADCRSMFNLAKRNGWIDEVIEEGKARPKYRRRATCAETINATYIETMTQAASGSEDTPE